MIYGVLNGAIGKATKTLQGNISSNVSVSGELDGEATGKVSSVLHGAISGGSVSGEIARKSVKVSDVLQGDISASIEPVENYPEAYTGSYVVDPLKREQILPTENKVMTQDLKVLGIYYYEVTNANGGKTVTIGRD